MNVFNICDPGRQSIALTTRAVPSVTPKLSCTIFYVIAVEEIRFTKELEDVKLDKVNEDVCLECELSKDGQKVEWFKDSKKIRPDLEHDIQDEGKIHRLIIKKATPKDIGTYRADYMHLSTSAKLSIEGKQRSSYLISCTWLYIVEV